MARDVWWDESSLVQFQRLMVIISRSQFRNPGMSSHNSSMSPQSGGTISGASFGVYIAGGGGTVTNAGTISGGTLSVEFAALGLTR